MTGMRHAKRIFALVVMMAGFDIRYGVDQEQTLKGFVLGVAEVVMIAGGMVAYVGIRLRDKGSDR